MRSHTEGGVSRRRDCHLTDTPCSSPLKHLATAQRGAIKMTVSPTAVGGVVLLDEVEKAHPEVLDLFLPALQRYKSAAGIPYIHR